MTEIAKRKATYADLEAVHPHLVAEIIYGSLVTHPRPTPRHAAAHHSLGSELGGPFQNGRGGPGGWIFLTEPELHFGEDIVVPDLAGWKRERLSPFPETAYIETPPDWLCEILSESTERFDRREKREIYARVGVKHLWLLDPRKKNLECYALVAGKWLLGRIYLNNEIVSAPPFEVASFAINKLWPFDDVKKISE